MPQPFNAGASSQPTFSSAENKSQIVVEKREDVVKPNVAVAGTKSPPKEGPLCFMTVKLTNHLQVS